MPKLSAIIITRNESSNIDGALASVAWADERLVVDAESTDDTVMRARQAGARVIVRPWPGYGAQKNFAAAEAAHDWILSLDADERISELLVRQIRSVLAADPPSRGYAMPRVTWYLGQWIRSTDWYPDYQLRLYDRRAATWSSARVHESVKVNGPTSVLSDGEIEHYAFRDISHHLQTIDLYTTLAAEQMLDDGRRVGLLGLLVHPPAAFVRNFFLRGGVRDGAVGAIVSAMNAYYVFLKVAKLWQKQHQ